MTERLVSAVFVTQHRPPPSVSRTWIFAVFIMVRCRLARCRPGLERHRTSVTIGLDAAGHRGKQHSSAPGRLAARNVREIELCERAAATCIGQVADEGASDHVEVLAVPNRRIM